MASVSTTSPVLAGNAVLSATSPAVAKAAPTSEEGAGRSANVRFHCILLLLQSAMYHQHLQGVSRFHFMSTF